MTSSDCEAAVGMSVDRVAPTDFGVPAKDTDKTDETCVSLTNEAFLSAIFDGLDEPNRPFVLGFTGDPKTRKGWGGTPWSAGKIAVSALDLNWYFTLAVFRPTDGFHRRENDCAAIYGVMLDDVGTKALPPERLDACPPSYLIETSPGNFQAGYLFTNPVTDIARVTALNRAMVDAGLCDPGAKSPATRYGRMPVARNGKSTPAFSCRLAEWQPDRRYTVDEIAERLELSFQAVNSRGKAKAARKAETIDAFNDGVYQPRAGENEVIVALKSRGLYKRPLGSGKHDMTCPWLHEHTDLVDHGTAYFEPNDLFPVGGFKCQHQHGDQYRVGKLIEFLGLTFHQAKHRPSIRVEPGELHRIVDAAERELAGSGRYYQRGGLIVSVQTDPTTNDTAIRPVSQPSLLRALSSLAIWKRFDARSDAYVVCDPPTKHVAVLFDAEGYAHLPGLAGIARQPYLRPDGTLCTAAGYDPATGMFGVFDERRFSVPKAPTVDDAVRALVELRGLLTEFDFTHDHDEAAAVVAMLTAAIRPSLPAAPMFHIRAPQIASGKSYLSNLIAAFATATPTSALAFPTNEEEAHKLLLASLLSAPAVLAFDNLTTDLIPFKSLCSALTEESLTGRVLGVSKTATVGTRALFLSSGNNVDAVRDMTRRVVTIALDPKVERPATRRFDRDPLRVVRADRERFVSLALTIVRARIVSTDVRPKLSSIGSYEAWSEWVRQAVVWLEMPDPLVRMFETMDHDPDREALGRLIAAWSDAFGTTPKMVRDAVDLGIRGNRALREALAEVAEERGEINARRAGRWINRHQGRIVDGRRFERASASTSAQQWVVKSVSSVSSVPEFGRAKSVISKPAAGFHPQQGGKDPTTIDRRY
jgi:hypothetical protein